MDNLPGLAVLVKEDSARKLCIVGSGERGQDRMCESVANMTCDDTPQKNHDHVRMSIDLIRDSQASTSDRNTRASLNLSIFRSKCFIKATMGCLTQLLLSHGELCHLPNLL